MEPLFSEQFDSFGVWRKNLATQVGELRQWLVAQELLDVAVQEHLQRLETHLSEDKVSVAFVAEFSRGKSELINAVFFAGYGRKIMPATVGRTTMCPTELSYTPSVPACLRLLPVQTRAKAHSLAQWRLRSSAWHEVPLDMNNPEQLAQAMSHVVQVQKVSVEEAQTLGFWSDTHSDNLLRDEQGMVEIPKWRHAIVNMAHPLLKQGLVIIDTPGLNAVGTEPELTVNLIAQAHAVVFLLAADAGVTKSDLAIWKEHLLHSHRHGEAHLVVLNKIDTLWGSLDSPEEIQAQLAQQCAQTAKILEIDSARIVPISAQQGLKAKIEHDPILLAHSGLAKFENMLAQGILKHRQSILRNAMQSVLTQMQEQVLRSINIRRLYLDEQMMDLRSLRGKNASVIQSMRQRIELEQKTFEASANKIFAVRSVHMKLMNQAFQLLGASSLRTQLQALTSTLEQAGIKLGVRKVYAATFEHLRGLGQQVIAHSIEIQEMLTASFKDLNTEFGFALQYPRPLQLHDFESELQQLEESYMHYLSAGLVFKLANPAFGQRLVKALEMRLRVIFESAANDLDLWSKSTTSQLDAQLKERKRSFVRRIDAVDRIRDAASGLMLRIAEIEAAEQQLLGMEQQVRQRVLALSPSTDALPPTAAAEPSLS